MAAISSANAQNNNNDRWSEIRKQRRGDQVSVDKQIEYGLIDGQGNTKTKVKAGDTLYDYAEAINRLDQSTADSSKRSVQDIIKQIQESNNIKDPRRLKAGQDLDLSSVVNKQLQKDLQAGTNTVPEKQSKQAKDAAESYQEPAQAPSAASSDPENKPGFFTKVGQHIDEANRRDIEMIRAGAKKFNEIDQKVTEGVKKGVDFVVESQAAAQKKGLELVGKTVQFSYENGQAAVKAPVNAAKEFFGSAKDSFKRIFLGEKTLENNEKSHESNP